MEEAQITKYCYSAAIIRPSDHALLIVQRADSEDFFPGYWELPGGHAEDGETIEAALRREVSEETKLTLVVPKFTPYFSFVYGKQMNKLEQHFLCEAQNDPILADAEHQAFKWITNKAELDALPISDMMRKSLEKALLLSQLPILSSQITREPSKAPRP